VELGGVMRALVVVVLLGVTPMAHSEEPAPATPTRAGLLRQQREAKGAQPPLPYRPAFLERQILSFEKAERPSFLDLHYKGFWPSFTEIASGSRQAAGLRFWQPSLFGSSLSFHASASWSIASYHLYDAQLGRIPHHGDRLPERSTKGDDVYELGGLDQGHAAGLILYGSFRARNHTRERFYGLGDDSRPEDLTAFSYEDVLGELVAGWQFTRHLSLNVRAGYLGPSAAPGQDPERPSVETVFDEETAPGLTADPEYLRLGAQVFLDRRDVPFNPHKGFVATAAWVRYDEQDGDLWSFDRFAFDVRGYLPLGSVQRVLAVRAYASADDPREGAQVPFYMQEALSNSRTLRGYDSFRFRGEKLVSLQAEYRWEAAPALELVAFVDSGRAFREDEEIELDGLRATFGGGLRLKAWNDTFFRFDVGRSDEGTRVYLRFGPSY
jgi:hypothetical protein